MYEQNSAIPSNKLNNLVGASTARVSDTPIRETETFRVMNKLFAVIELCQLTSSHLSERLIPIMGPELPKEKEAPVEAEFYSPLAQEINRAVDSLTRINNNLQEMKDRVQL